MEQRNSDRKAVSYHAVIGCTRFGMIRGEIIDLAEGGVYVQAETSIVPLGASVTVTFQPGDSISNDCLSLRGKVAHQSLQGFGIAFCDLDQRCTEALARLLPTLPAAPVRAMPVLRVG